MAYRHPLAFAVLRRSARSIPLFRADGLPFTAQIVEHSRYLPLVGQWQEGAGSVPPTSFAPIRTNLRIAGFLVSPTNCATRCNTPAFKSGTSSGISPLSRRRKMDGAYDPAQPQGDDVRETHPGKKLYLSILIPPRVRRWFFW